MKKLIAIATLIVVIASGNVAWASDELEATGNQILNIANSVQKFDVQHVAGDSANVVTSSNSSTASEIQMQAEISNSASGTKQTLVISPEEATSNVLSMKSGSKTARGHTGSQYVIETANGNMRIVASSPDEFAAKKVRYKTSLPKDSYLVELTDGSFQILDSTGTYLGSFAKPWAIDASGLLIETRLSLHKGRLTQEIDVIPATRYPVVSDPSWYYSIDLSLNNYYGPSALFFSGRTPSYVTGLLKSCFNCYFPVSGAPIWYPYVGQVMYLTITNPEFWKEPMPAPVQVTSVFDYGWKFNALPGHIDGVGSAIRFSWYRDASYHLHLAVSATIANPNPCNFIFSSTCQPVYTTFATQTWQKLFNNVTL
jgi:hypothetical protein